VCRYQGIYVYTHIPKFMSVYVWYVCTCVCMHMYTHVYYLPKCVCVCAYTCRHTYEIYLNIYV